MSVHCIILCIHKMCVKFLNITRVYASLCHNIKIDVCVCEIKESIFYSLGMSGIAEASTQ